MSPQSAASYFTPTSRVVQQLKYSSYTLKRVTKGRNKNKTVRQGKWEKRKKERTEEKMEEKKTKNVRKRKTEEKQDISHSLGRASSVSS